MQAKTVLSVPVIIKYLKSYTLTDQMCSLSSHLISFLLIYSLLSSPLFFSPDIVLKSF